MMGVGSNPAWKICLNIFYVIFFISPKILPQKNFPFPRHQISNPVQFIARHFFLIILLFWNSLQLTEIKEKRTIKECRNSLFTNYNKTSPLNSKTLGKNFKNYQKTVKIFALKFRD
jgi:hypothetical protein